MFGGEWVEVYYETVAIGDAIAGSDYTHTEGTLRWDPFDPVTKQIPVNIINDDLVEDSESFEVRLSNPRSDINNGAHILGGADTTTGTITNGDPGAPVSLNIRIVDGPGDNSVDIEWGSGNSSCTGNCTGGSAIQIPVGADVMLTANADAGAPNRWYFDQFAGDISSTNNPYIFEINGSKRSLEWDGEQPNHMWIDRSTARMTSSAAMSWGLSVYSTSLAVTGTV